MSAIVSVHDKRGVADFARMLVERGVQLYATEGSGDALRAGGLPVTPISQLTGFTELLNGRVKTLHPHIHAGILAADEPAQLEELSQRGIPRIDFVVVNLYPLPPLPLAGNSGAEVLAQVDIGGVALLRAAAKNCARVTVVTGPQDYEAVARELRADGRTSLTTRRRLALAAFAQTATYDAQIANHLTGEAVPLPAHWLWVGHKAQDLRYGENPHQRAAAYRAGPAGIIGARQWQGGDLSFNNLVDLDAAWGLVLEFDGPGAAIVKHSNPCGVALGLTVAEAYRRAHAADPRAAFGGIVALNREADAAVAELITQTFVEAMVAPGVSADAIATLQRKAKMRVVTVGGEGGPPALEMRSVSGGFLLQTADRGGPDGQSTRVVTSRQPTEGEWEDLRFAWRVAKHVKSNAVVLAHQGCAVGVGAGQMSRVESAELAVRRAGPRARGSVAASDGFFPKLDGVLTVARAGATAIIQPGGSVADSDSIKAADAAGLAMVFTGTRHFRH